MNKSMFIVLEQIYTTRNRLLEQVKSDGPMIVGIFEDKYADLTGSEPAYDELQLKNTFLSLISHKIDNPDLADKILELGTTNKYAMALFMKQLLATTDVCKSNPEVMLEFIYSGLQPKEIVDIMKIAREIYNLKSVNLSNERIRKEKFVRQYGYAVVNELILGQIVKFCLNSTNVADKILEVGSGLGFVAFMLQYWGLDVTATDVGLTGGYNIDFSKSWVPIQMLNYDTAIKTYGSNHNVLLLAWPPLEEDVACKSIELFPGSKVIYIGECCGGSTANTKFFSVINDKFILRDVVRVPNWPELYVRMYLYERK